MEHRDLEPLDACPLCRQHRLMNGPAVVDHFLSKETFSIASCATCGFMFTAPRPGRHAIGTYYKSANYLSHAARKRGLVPRLYRAIRAYQFGVKYRMLRRYVPPGRALDVGCGTGEWLSYLQRKGFQTEGVEPGVEAREAAIAHHGLRVVASMNDLGAPESYDLITLWHVLEHLPDPQAAVVQLHGLLRPGGLLVIAVPDRGSWDARHYGTYWAAWDVPRHLSHFTRTDLHRLLIEHGFNLKQERRMWFDAFYVALLSETYRGRSRPMAFLLAIAKGAWSNIHALVNNAHASSMIQVAIKAQV